MADDDDDVAAAVASAPSETGNDAESVRVARPIPSSVPVRTGSEPDWRVQWFRDTLTNLMGVDDTKYAEAAINEHRDECGQFFDDVVESYADVHKQCIFVWRTFYDRLVEEMVTELEEVRPETPVLKPTKGKGKKGKVKPIAVEKPEPVFVEVQRIVQTFVKTPIVHLFFGTLPDEDIKPEINYYYLIRKAPAEIRKLTIYQDLKKNPNAVCTLSAHYETRDECFAEIPRFFLFGSFRGNMMHTILRVAQTIYPKAIEFQFREGEQSHENIFPEQSDIGDNEEIRIELIDFSRPSDYRMKTVMAPKKDGSGDRLEEDESVTEPDELDPAEIAKQQKILGKTSQMSL